MKIHENPLEISKESSPGPGASQILHGYAWGSDSLGKILGKRWGMHEYA